MYFRPMLITSDINRGHFKSKVLTQRPKLGIVIILEIHQFINKG